MSSVFIELHDARITECTSQPGTGRLTIRMVATVHRSDGKAGVDPGMASEHEVAFQIENAHMPTASVPEDMCVMAGSLTLDDVVHDNGIVLPVPEHTQCTVRFELEDASTVSIGGGTLSCVLSDARGSAYPFPGSSDTG